MFIQPSARTAKPISVKLGRKSLVSFFVLFIFSQINQNLQHKQEPEVGHLVPALPDSLAGDKIRKAVRVKKRHV
jgi:hypothetical protein